MNGVDRTPKSAITPLTQRAVIVVPPPLPPLTASGFCLSTSSHLPPASQLLHETDSSSSSSYSSDQSRSPSRSASQPSPTYSAHAEQSNQDDSPKTRRSKSQQRQRSFQGKSFRKLSPSRCGSRNQGHGLLHTEDSTEQAVPPSEELAKDASVMSPVDTPTNALTATPPSSPINLNVRPSGATSPWPVPGHDRNLAKTTLPSPNAAQKPPQPQGEVSAESYDSAQSSNAWGWQAARAALQILRQGENSSSALRGSRSEPSGKPDARQPSQLQSLGRKSGTPSTGNSPAGSGQAQPSAPAPRESTSVSGPKSTNGQHIDRRRCIKSGASSPREPHPEQSNESAVQPNGSVSPRNWLGSSPWHNSRRRSSKSPTGRPAESSSCTVNSGPLWWRSHASQTVHKSAMHNSNGPQSMDRSKGQGNGGPVDNREPAGPMEGKAIKAIFHPQGLPPCRWLPVSQPQESKLLESPSGLTGVARLLLRCRSQVSSPQLEASPKACGQSLWCHEDAVMAVLILCFPAENTSDSMSSFDCQHVLEVPSITYNIVILGTAVHTRTDSNCCLTSVHVVSHVFHTGHLATRVSGHFHAPSRLRLSLAKDIMMQQPLHRTYVEHETIPMHDWNPTTQKLHEQLMEAREGLDRRWSSRPASARWAKVHIHLSTCSDV
jgi:hypothetical protein